MNAADLRFIVVFTLLLTLTATSTLSGSTGESFTLSNGIHVYLEKRDTVPLVNVVAAVALNPLQESRQKSGYTHLIEHLILTGSTSRRTSGQWIKECRRHGAYTNAHTDHDTLTLEISLPARHLKFALDYIRQKLFELEIHPSELENEKRVILEEIRQLEDTPLRIGTQRVLEALFRKGAYSWPLTGSRPVIESADSEDLEHWYRRRIQSGRLSLAVIGDLTSDGLRSILNRSLGTLPAVGSRRIGTPAPPEPLDHDIPLKHRMDIHQAHLFLGFLAPPFAHPHQSGLDILVHIFGRGISPLLGTLSRRRQPLADNFSVRYLAFRYAGAVIFHLVTTPDRIYSLKREIREFLKRSRTFRFSRDDFPAREQSMITDYLQSARNQILMRSQQLNENGLRAAISLARYFLLQAPGKGPNYTQGLKATTSKRLREIASRYFSGEEAVIMEILPKTEANR